MGKWRSWSFAQLYLPSQRRLWRRSLCPHRLSWAPPQRWHTCSSVSCWWRCWSVAAPPSRRPWCPSPPSCPASPQWAAELESLWSLNGVICLFVWFKGESLRIVWEVYGTYEKTWRYSLLLFFFSAVRWHFCATSSRTRALRRLRLSLQSVLLSGRSESEYSKSSTVWYTLHEREPPVVNTLLFPNHLRYFAW